VINEPPPATALTPPATVDAAKRIRKWDESRRPQ
jgi:hypothetical protein